MIKCLRILVAVLDVSNILVFGNLKRLFGPWKDNSFLRKLFPTSSSAQVAFTIPFYKMCKKSHIILIAWHHIILMRRVSLKVYPFFPLPPVNFNLLFFILRGNHHLEMSFMAVLKCKGKSNYSIKWKASKYQVSYYLKTFYNHLFLLCFHSFR